MAILMDMATNRIQGIETTETYRDLESQLATARTAERAVVFTLTADSTPDELQVAWRAMDVTNDLKRRLDAERRTMIDGHCARHPY